MIRIGLLGAAGIAPQALVNPARRRDDVTVEAIAARNGASAERFATENDIPTALQGYQSLLDLDEVDLVYIALPPSEHAHWSIAAMEAGKDVLCEKPITMDADEAEQVAAVAARTGRLVIEAFHDHYHPLTGRMLDLVQSGAIGDLVSIRAAFTADNPFSPSSLRHVPELGGGALMDLGCYPVHWIRTIGGGEPSVVSASHIAGPLGADETIDAELELPGGVEVRLHASMAAGSAFAAPLSVIGTRGRLDVDNLVLPHLGHSVSLERDGRSDRLTVGGRETYDHELDAVVQAVESREEPDTGPADFIATMRVMDAIHLAAGVARPRGKAAAS
ncbi:MULTISPECIES: Gfo/Idh/MocA family oxidoreductase [unclassified Rathayibacter]|uniref:Gfo/Idh/MocA family protein n=1 Tax=unclassified Rathayibacter TaxID=2609250 RepID=UPI001045A2E1|nr:MULTISPECIES: Gfo/Idh/MocA family oxidoreductase [unclassified Rathayibacter]MCJ1675555.1 Gfo/Idh/MocA family oxidoreductase [Rathayibacter sp. VKM Ac-2929]TCL79500.1 putative dehydrogenase [Rathayibacter sp. PhB192]TCM25231.1 putative dehydrogenase [Rathayibacter sp. PhB179]